MSFVEGQGNSRVIISSYEGARRFIAGAWEAFSSTPLENLTSAARNPSGAINDAGRAVVAFVQTNGTVDNLYANVYNGTAWQTAATAVDDLPTANVAISRPHYQPQRRRRTPWHVGGTSVWPWLSRRLLEPARQGLAEEGKLLHGPARWYGHR